MLRFMITIHGPILDGLDNYFPQNVHLPEPDTSVIPDWGISSLTDALGPPRRGTIVLVTGAPGVGKTSLLRSIALASAERGFTVDLHSHKKDDLWGEARRLASAATGRDLNSSGNTEPRAVPGRIRPIHELPGQIRLRNTRTNLFEYEMDMDMPQVMICDEPEVHLQQDDRHVIREHLLRRLVEAALCHNILVVVAFQDCTRVESECLMDEPRWKRHVSTHLEVLGNSGTKDYVPLDVVKHGNRQPALVIRLADQRSIGRLGDCEPADTGEGPAPSAGTGFREHLPGPETNQSAVQQLPDKASAQEGPHGRNVDEDDIAREVEAALWELAWNDPETLLAELHLDAYFDAWSWDVGDNLIKVDRVLVMEDVPIETDRTEDFWHHVRVTARIKVKHMAGTVTQGIDGLAGVLLTSEGRVLEASVEEMFDPDFEP